MSASWINHADAWCSPLVVRHVSQHFSDTHHIHHRKSWKCLDFWFKEELGKNLGPHVTVTWRCQWCHWYRRLPGEANCHSFQDMLSNRHVWNPGLPPIINAPLIPLAIRNPPIIHHSFFASKFKIDMESGNSANVDHLESETLFTYSIDNNIMIYHIYIYIYIWYIHIYIHIWYIYTYIYIYHIYIYYNIIYIIIINNYN